MNIPSLISVARGDAPADLVLRGGRVVNVFSGELEEVDVAVVGPWIAALGPGYDGENIIDLEGRYLAPGFIDAHVHIESSMATPREFARAVVPRGTTTVVSDPHEIANVHGLEGIRFMLEASEGLPLTVFVMAPSCVPATHMGTAGATLEAEDLETFLDHPRVLGLAEVMNFPGVILEDQGVWAKLRAFSGRPVDGHAPGVRGKSLNAYIAGGPGSDHECTSWEEAVEKLRRGMMVFFRDATNARNLKDLLPALTSRNLHRVALCTDDRQPPDLLGEGGIDAMLRTVIRSGLPAIEAIRLATLNPCEHYGLRDRGGISPGRRADLVVLEDLDELKITQVFAGGVSAAVGGEALPWELPPPPPPPAPSMRIDETGLDFRIPGQAGKARVIRVIPHQIVTETEELFPSISGDQVRSDPSRDLLKIAVIDRHTGSGRVGLGLVKGVGLQRGALAGTVAHDHHNLVVIGVDDTSMGTAVADVAEMGGGLSVTLEKQVLARLPLPIGGLMSAKTIEEVSVALAGVLDAARNLGSPLHDPFMAMAFLCLEVIPSLKITDQGLVDVDRFEKVGFWV